MGTAIDSKQVERCACHQQVPAWKLGTDSKQVENYSSAQRGIWESGVEVFHSKTRESWYEMPNRSETWTQKKWSSTGRDLPTALGSVKKDSEFKMRFSSATVQLSSVAQSCPTLCDPMNHSTPGFPVHHQLPEFTQIHAHWVGDAIQPSHPLSPPSPPAPNASQHQGLFQWVSSSHKVAKVLEFQLQHQSFQWTPRTDLL